MHQLTRMFKSYLKIKQKKIKMDHKLADYQTYKNLIMEYLKAPIVEAGKIAKDIAKIERFNPKFIKLFENDTKK